MPPENAIGPMRGDWDSRLTAYAATPANRLASDMDQERREAGLPLSLWPADNLPAQLRSLITLSDHPCGQTGSLFLRRIPVGDPYVAGETVVEFDADGAGFRRWPLPADLTVAGVEGNRILTSPPWYHDGRALSVRARIEEDGRYRVIPMNPLPAPEQMPCPQIAGLPRSDYVRCWVFQDAGGNRRTLAYQAPCT